MFYLDMDGCFEADTLQDLFDDVKAFYEDDRDLKYTSFSRLYYSDEFAEFDLPQVVFDSFDVEMRIAYMELQAQLKDEDELRLENTMRFQGR